jgi:hypothetical protein
MDNYQLKEMDLLKKIGINFNKITITQWKFLTY